MPADKEPLSDEELDRAEGDVLPEREVMSIISPAIDDPLPPSAVLDPLPPDEEI